MKMADAFRILPPKDPTQMKIAATAAVLALATTTFAQAQGPAPLARLDKLPAAYLLGAQRLTKDDGELIVPSSSVRKRQEAGTRVHTNVRILVPNASPMTSQTLRPAGLPPYAGHAYETPATLACIYAQVTASGGCKPDAFTTVATGGSRAIAIVDAYHYPNAQRDLAAYSAQFGLPAPTAASFVQVNLGGTATDDGWGQEAALDIQMAHALAPNAKIYLVEAASSSLGDMLAAVDKASELVSASGGGEVSMSWGSDEFVGEETLDSHFKKPNVVYFASTGDAVSPSWPAVSANVVAVGGTTVARNAATLAFVAEDSWTSAGAGFSTRIARPSFQPTSVGATRGIPDISAVANPETGVWVRYTFASGGSQWMIFGGTSVAAPVMAAITNASGHFYASSAAQNAKIYANKAISGAFRASRTGDCGHHHAYMVGSAWNPCTGLGSANGRTHQ